MVGHDDVGKQSIFVAIAKVQGFDKYIPDFSVAQRAASISLVQQFFLNRSNQIAEALYCFLIPRLRISCIEPGYFFLQKQDALLRQGVGKAKGNELNLTLLMPVGEIATLTDQGMSMRVEKGVFINDFQEFQW